MLNMKFTKSVCWWLRALKRSRCMQVWWHRWVGVFTCVSQGLLKVLLVFVGFLFCTLRLDIWAPFLSTVNHNTINVFCMQVSVHPACLPFSPPLPPGNRIACWFGSVFQLGTMCCVALRKKSWKVFLDLGTGSGEARGSS